MRDILFKAERLDNGEEIVGYYLEENHLGVLVPAIMYYNRLSGEDEYVQIDPNTLSQLLYTNKKGVRFFDGDVVKHKYCKDDCSFKVFYSEEHLSVCGQVFDEHGEYDLIILYPKDFEELIVKLVCT